MLIGYARVSTEDQHLDLQQHGYRGSYPTLARYLRRLPAAANVIGVDPTFATSAAK